MLISHFIILHILISRSSKVLCINDKFGNQVLLVDPTMPNHLKRNIMTFLLTIFPDILKDTDSRQAGINFTYQCLHFTIYNQFSTQVSTTHPFVFISFLNNNYRAIMLLLTNLLRSLSEQALIASPIYTSSYHAAQKR